MNEAFVLHTAKIVYRSIEYALKVKTVRIFFSNHFIDTNVSNRLLTLMKKKCH